jgi:hypothetical protein
LKKGEGESYPNRNSPGSKPVARTRLAVKELWPADVRGRAADRMQLHRPSPSRDGRHSGPVAAAVAITHRRPGDGGDSLLAGAPPLPRRWQPVFCGERGSSGRHCPGVRVCVFGPPTPAAAQRPRFIPRKSADPGVPSGTVQSRNSLLRTCFRAWRSISRRTFGFPAHPLLSVPPHRNSKSGGSLRRRGCNDLDPRRGRRHACGGQAMSLEPETLRRMAACFGGRSCRRCGRPAERLAHGCFYCERHRPLVRSAHEESAPKVYRCRYSPWAGR